MEGNVNRDDDPIKFDTLDFGTQLGFIEDHFGRRRFYLKLESGGLMEYEKKILSGKAIPFLLPMNFIHFDGEDKIYYDFTGYLQLEDYIRFRAGSRNSERSGNRMASDFLQIICNLMQCIKGLEDYLLSYDRVSLRKETVFLDAVTGRTALAMIPGESYDEPLRVRLMKLLEEIAAAYEEPEIENYLRRLKDTVYEKNMGLEGMISTVGMMQREISYIQWSNPDFRKNEDECCQVQASLFSEGGGGTDPDRDATSFLSKVLRDRKKFVLIQAAIIIGMILLFFSGMFHITDFIGFCVITAGVDLWLVRSLKLTSSLQAEQEYR